MLTESGKQLVERMEEVAGEQKYRKAFQLLINWIDGNLDIYKVWLWHSLILSLILCHDINITS